jgi:hypothetical protein
MPFCTRRRRWRHAVLHQAPQMLMHPRRARWLVDRGRRDRGSASLRRSDDAWNQRTTGARRDGRILGRQDDRRDAHQRVALELADDRGGRWASARVAREWACVHESRNHELPSSLHHTVPVRDAHLIARPDGGDPCSFDDHGLIAQPAVVLDVDDRDVPDADRPRLLADGRRECGRIA